MLEYVSFGQIRLWFDQISISLDRARLNYNMLGMAKEGYVVDQIRLELGSVSVSLN